MSSENVATVDLHLAEGAEEGAEVKTKGEEKVTGEEAATADTFAKQFLDDLFTKKIEKPDLSAFEQETLDLNITSKYDDLPEVEDEVAKSAPEPAASVATFEAPEPAVAVSTSEAPEPAVAASTFETPEPAVSTSEAPEPAVVVSTSEAPEPAVAVSTFEAPEPTAPHEAEHQQAEPVAEPKPDPVPEPAVCSTFTVETSNVEETSKIDVNNNTNVDHDKVSSVPELAAADHQSEFHHEAEKVVLKEEEEEARPASPVEEKFEVKHNTFTEEEHSQTNGHGKVDEEEEEEEENDTFEEKVSPPKEEPKQEAIDLEDELGELKFKKLGVAKSLWTSKRSEVKHEADEDEKPAFDKFRTIRQNIKKGNTRSLKERFENFGKF